MKVLLTFNDKYAPHAAVVMESIIRNAAGRVGFIIMHYENDLNADMQNTFKKHFGERVESLEFRSVGERMKQHFASVQYASYLSVNAFLRLLSPDVLQNENTVLYLDCDLIVLGDIIQLMQLTDPSYAVNAVPEHKPSPRISVLEAKPVKTEQERGALHIEHNQMVRKRQLGMSPESAYFNTGVMIMNLKLWREEALFDRILEFIGSHCVLYSGDQDALNGVLDGNFGELPLAWNVHPYVKSLNEYSSTYSSSELYEAREHPQIIHFAGYKAWEYRYENEQEKQLYWQYRSFTPWPQKQENGKTPRAVINKRVKIPFIRAIKRLLGDRNITKIKKILAR